MPTSEKATFVDELLHALGEAPTRQQVEAVLRKWAGGKVYVNARPLRRFEPADVARRLVFSGVTRTSAVETLCGRGVSDRHARRLVAQAVAERGQAMTACLRTLAHQSGTFDFHEERTAAMATTIEQLQTARAQYRELVIALTAMVGRINALEELHQQETLPAAVARKVSDQQPIRLPTMGAFARNDTVIVSGVFELSDGAPTLNPPGFVVQTTLGHHLASAVARAEIETGAAEGGN